MKFSLLVATMGAFFLSSVEALKRHHDDDYQDEQPPCADDDDQCWLDLFGIDCQPTDDECIKAAFSDIFGLSLPDCAEDDQACWDAWAADQQDNGDQQSHKRNIRVNHKSRAAAKHVKKIMNHFGGKHLGGRHHQKATKN